MARILIVDDSTLSRRILGNILEATGHQVVEAPDGMAALERYALERPDLVLLDLTMPGMHGLEVLGRLRELDPQARVVIATADIQEMTWELARDGGARGFIAKPFVPEEVQRAVAEALKEQSDANL